MVKPTVTHQFVSRTVGHSQTVSLSCHLSQCFLIKVEEFWRPARQNWILILSFCLCVLSFVSSDAPECRDYDVLSESSRHPSYGRGTNSDSSLAPGWYRFQSSSYTRMIDSCIPVHRCLTNMPGWLNEGQPTLEDGIVLREACFSAFYNCCYRRVQVRVRKCGGFFVHELPPSPTGKFRYCAKE